MPGGITVIEPGVDHFYRDPEINLKSLAIVNLVADELKYNPISGKQMSGSIVASSQIW